MTGALVGVGCGGGRPGGTGGTTGGQPQTLDCNWLASNNCWKIATAAAAECLPAAGPSASGLLSSDGTSCTFDGGDRVAFATPEVFPFPQQVSWNFTVTQPDGGLCLSYRDEASGGFTLESPAGTVVSGGSVFSYTVTCPDGTVYSSPDALQLLSCGDDSGVSFGGLPGSASSYSPTTGVAGTPPADLSFSLLGSAGGSLPVFECASAP